MDSKPQDSKDSPSSWAESASSWAETDRLAYYLTIVGRTVMILVGMNLGGLSHPWKSATVICLLVFAVFTLILFILVEWKIPRVPFIPLSIINTWQRSPTLVAALLHGFVLYITFYFLPLYFQSVLGAGALF